METTEETLAELREAAARPDACNSDYWAYVAAVEEAGEEVE